jgi:uncharacterized protein YehS (DUF1456 family)
MTNNDVLRRVRYIFDYNDEKMISLFALAEQTVSRSDVSAWMKKEEDEGFQPLEDAQLALFLDGLIVDKRGPKDGPQHAPETQINNNIVFRKLKIALDLKAEDILELLETVETKISKHELSAFFRKPGHKHFRACNNQIMRSFLKSIQLRERPSSPWDGD